MTKKSRNSVFGKASHKPRDRLGHRTHLRSSNQRGAKKTPIRENNKVTKYNKTSHSPVIKIKRGTSDPRAGSWHAIGRTHWAQFCQANSQLLKKPFSSFFTVLVLSLIIAIPILVYLTFANANAAMNNWSANNTFSVFIEKDQTEDEVIRIKAAIQSNILVKQATYISPEQGLNEFKEKTQLARFVTLLDKNPIPPMLEVTPVSDISAANYDNLIEHVTAIKGVDTVKLDAHWVDRMRASIDFGGYVASILVSILVISAFLTIVNTIRLLIINRKEEISIIRLVGGSRGYIMLPFMYSGFWYGLLSSILGCTIAAILFSQANHALTSVSSLYQSTFTASFLGAKEVLILILMCVGIATVAAIFATHRQLYLFETKT